MANVSIEELLNKHLISNIKELQNNKKNIIKIKKTTKGQRESA